MPPESTDYEGEEAEVEADVEKLEEQSEELEQEIEESRRDWGSKQQDDRVPGAIPDDQPRPGDAEAEQSDAEDEDA